MKGLWIGLVGVLAVGCTPTEAQEDSPSVNKALSTVVPEYTVPSNLKLPNGRRYISLGDSDEKALNIFPKTPRAFPLEDSVPSFPSDFHAKGWESNVEGFGIILHEDKIVLAMHQWESVDPDEFASILKNVQDTNEISRFQSTTVNKADYWYVQSGQDELIISRLPGSKKKYQVTVTLGNQHVIDALGILKGMPKSAVFQTDKHAK